MLYHRNIENIFFVTIFSHALWLYSPRSHINSLEMTICVVTMYCYKIGSKQISAVLGAWICYLRPTSIFLIGTMYLKDFASMKSLLPVGIITGLALICVDCVFYREFVLPPYNFYNVNIYTKSSDLFGKQPFYLYVIFLTILCGLLLPLAIKSFINELKNVAIYLKLFRNKTKDATVEAKISKYCFYKEIMLSSVLFFMFYSIVPHKEMRFLLPLVPFINILSARMLNNKIRLILLLQLCASIFIGFTHQKYGGTIDYLRNIDYKEETKILYAVCPYSLPAYSYVCHKNATIDCITGEKDIFSKFKPRFYKRFGCDVKVNQYAKFIGGEYKQYDFDKYNYVLLYDWSYKMMHEKLTNFEVVARKRYALVNFETDKGLIIFILKKKV